MVDQTSDTATEARLRGYLAAELRRAEVDFPHISLRASQPRRWTAPIRLVAILASFAVVALLVRPGGGGLLGGPGALPLGPDGIPLSIDGQPVLRGADLDARLVAGGDSGPFLAGGYLVLRGPACLTPAPVQETTPAPSVGCREDWRLEDVPTGVAGHSVPVEGAPFVRTSGAPTVLSVTSLNDRALLIEAVPWRQPTKGRIPAEATPPEGGDTNMALVPDFVSTLGGPTGETIVGYVPKDLMLNPQTTPGGTPENPPQDLPAPVYGEDLTTLVGHMVAGQGFVPLGASPAPNTVAGSPSEGPSPAPVVTCAGITDESCQEAVGLVRERYPHQVAEAVAIVVSDICPPTVLCDRLYPFDSIVVLVPPAGAPWTRVTVHVVGSDGPERVEPWPDALPQHIAALLPAP